MTSSTISSIVLDASLDNCTVDIQQERRTAIYALVQESHFVLHGEHLPPYDLHVRVAESRLIMAVTPASEEKQKVTVSLQPLRMLIKDYFLICESYTEAVSCGNVRKIEAIDMGRRGLHDEGSELLQELMEQKVEVDFDTARRFFTLICTLYMK